MSDNLEHDHDHEPDPAGLGATMNGEAAVEPSAGSYDIPLAPTPEEADKAAQARKCLTAFLVVVETDGTAWATNTIDLNLEAERQPTMGDMYRSCAEVMKDIEAVEITQRTVGMLAQVWPQLQAQQAELDRQNKIANKLMQRGIHVPGRNA